MNRATTRLLTSAPRRPSCSTTKSSKTPQAGDFDSAAEDCTTGIALATDEATGMNLFITDLTQATFKAGTPGTWTAPSQLQLFPEFQRVQNSAEGIAIAPGTRLGIVTGEFEFGVGGGVGERYPASVYFGKRNPGGYGLGSLVPSDPSSTPWVQGCDPHTVTAYVSPNSHKAFGVLGNRNNSFLAVVNLKGLLSAPRSFAHVVVESLPPGLVTFIAQ